MAAGDWSFPKSGCRCIKFTSQFARRKWAGFDLHWDMTGLPSQSTSPFFTNPTPLGLRFLRVREEYHSSSAFGIADADFTREISTECADYGDTITTGVLPIPPGPVSIRLPADTTARSQINTSGAYVFRNEENAFTYSGQFNLESFTPGDEYVITLHSAVHNLFSQGGPSFYTTRVLDRECSQARMRDILLRDINAVRGGITSACAISATRGGAVEADDQYFLAGLVAQFNVPQNFPPIGPFIIKWPPGGHAMLHLAERNSTDWNYALRSTIYEPGLHSLHTVPLLDLGGAYVEGIHGTPAMAFSNTPTLSCENIEIECNGDAYEIEPPAVADNDKRILWIENNQCPNG